MPESFHTNPSNSVNHDDVFASSSRVSSESDVKFKLSPENIDPVRSHNIESNQNEEPTREMMLQRELKSVRSINKVIESVVSSLQRAKENMDTVSGTVNSASTLLNTWTRILSQTEHNQRLILDPNWKGASADILEAESESIKKAQTLERRRAEEERRREEEKKIADDEERQRQAGTTVRGVRGATSRYRSSRGASSSLSGHSSRLYSGMHSNGRGSQIARSGTGIKRGLEGSRGRNRDIR